MSLSIRLKYVNNTPKGSIVQLDMEDYLKGVIAAEIGSSFPAEAIKAQAIAARTYAARKINANSTYDVDDTTQYQAYNASRVTSRIVDAVEATAGLVLLYNNQLANTVYSASNGGRIRSSAEVWGGNLPYLISKIDNYTSRSGYGKYGHGVGMSQRGAQQAAKEGLSYVEILNFYYPGTVIVEDYNRVTNSTVSSTVNTPSTPISKKGNLIVIEAKKHLGAAYEWNAAGPSKFDNSGFVYYVYKNAVNYDWERMSAYSQYTRYGKTLGCADILSPGDLIFFKDTYRTGNNPNISHVAIATGIGDEFIHAIAGKGVIYGSLEETTFKSHVHSIKRILLNGEV